MTAPAPKRRTRSYDPKAHWGKVACYVPAALEARLRQAAEVEGKTRKDVVIEALRARLGSARGSESSDDSGDE